MYNKTQQWQVWPVWHAGWLGFFLVMALGGMLTFWAAQHKTSGALITALGVGLLLRVIRQRSSCSAALLCYSSHARWSLSTLAAEVYPLHLWCSPYFCTLLLGVNTERGWQRCRVVCWRHHHSPAQWHTLLRLLRTGSGTLLNNAQSLRNS